MKIGIMQPYFWPYLGYFQLISSVDKFVIYDNIQYTKKGWFNRNRYLCDSRDKYFSISIAKDSDFLDVRERMVSESFDKKKLKNQIKMAYSRATYFKDVYPIFCECVDYSENNLFYYIKYSLDKVLEYLNIDTEIIISSSIDIDHTKKGKNKVIDICKKLDANEYINPIGGQKLYDKDEFKSEGVDLYFIQMNTDIYYEQFKNEFVPGLSILVVMMFNSRQEIQKLLNRYTLI